MALNCYEFLPVMYQITAHILRSATLQLFILNVAVKHSCYLSYNRCAHSGCPSWLSFMAVFHNCHHTSCLPEIKLYKNLTYVLGVWFRLSVIKSNAVRHFFPSIIKITSHKKFSEGKQAHVGMEASKTNQTRWESMTPQHFHTIPTSCAILPPLTQYAYSEDRPYLPYSV